MPTCKKCKTELEFDDTIDEEVDGNVVRLIIVGHCPKCGTHYTWTDVYEFDRFEDLEECEQSDYSYFFFCAPATVAAAGMF